MRHTIVAVSDQSDGDLHVVSDQLPVHTVLIASLNVRNKYQSKLIIPHSSFVPSSWHRLHQLCRLGTKGLSFLQEVIIYTLLQGPGTCCPSV